MCAFNISAISILWRQIKMKCVHLLPPPAEGHSSALCTCEWYSFRGSLRGINNHSYKVSRNSITFFGMFIARGMTWDDRIKQVRTQVSPVIYTLDNIAQFCVSDMTIIRVTTASYIRIKSVGGGG